MQEQRCLEDGVLSLGAIEEAAAQSMESSTAELFSLEKIPQDHRVQPLTDDYLVNHFHFLERLHGW